MIVDGNPIIGRVLVTRAPTMLPMDVKAVDPNTHDLGPLPKKCIIFAVGKAGACCILREAITMVMT